MYGTNNINVYGDMKWYVRWYEKVQKKVKVTLKQAMKAQRGVEV
jgi:hypothetical protein